MKSTNTDQVSYKHKFIIISLISFVFLQFNCNHSNSKKGLLSSQINSKMDDVKNNNNNRFYLFFKAGKVDSCYYSGYEYINLTGFYFSQNEIDNMKYDSILGLDILPYINWNYKNEILSDSSEFIVYAKMQNYNINIYIKEIILNKKVTYLKEFLNQFTFNHPESEEFEMLIFPLITSNSDDSISSLFSSINKDVLLQIKKILFTDGYTLGRELNLKYMNKYYPKTMHRLNDL